MRMFSSSSSAATTIQLLPSLSGNLGRLELNNPSGLNALTIEMVRSLQSILNVWQSEGSSIKATLMIGRPHVNKRGETKPVFCSGGDVKSIYWSGSNINNNKNEDHGYGRKGLLTADFFREEYAVNYAIATQYERTNIPQISIWDGITMGGGVGVSIHGAYRVATENTIFAMPETSIGFFPDVGGMWFLPRLPTKGLGLYLALTGKQLSGAECAYFGLATHYVPSKQLEAMYKDLTDATITTKDMKAVLDRYHDKHEMELQIQNKSLLVPNMDIIAGAFHQKKSVEEVMSALVENGNDVLSPTTLKTLQSRSPTSLKVSLEGMRRGLQANNIGECLQMEFRLSQAFMRPGSDFYEGIRALLVDKDNALKWNPPSLDLLSSIEVESFFEPLGEYEWVIPKYQLRHNL